MAQSTELNYRMQQKRDYTRNWSDPSFTPKDGEIIVYKDENSASRIKIGDGENSLDNLKFITGEIYVQEELPQDAGNGAIWINPTDYSSGSSGNSGGSGGGVYVIPDYNVNEGEDGFIRNKPVSCLSEKVDLKVDPMTPNQIVQVKEEWFYKERISNVQISLKSAVQPNIINHYCTTQSELEQQVRDNLNTGESGIFFVKGSVFLFSTTSYVICLVERSSSDTITSKILFLANDSVATYNGNTIEQGSYFLCTDEGIYINELSFDYNRLVYENPKFEGIFKDPHAVNVYALDLEAISGIDQSGMFSFIMTEFSKYEPGSILTIPSAIIQMLKGYVESGGGG